MGFFTDSYYWTMVVPALILSFWASHKVKSTFQKYSSIPARVTGQQACRMIQEQETIRVPIEGIAGKMTDHYDPRGPVIRLSEPVLHAATVAAVGVAAHETGHAIQYERRYFPVRIRTAIIPATKFSSTLALLLFLAGILLNSGLLAYVGIGFFAVALLFQIVTLPVEFDASRRAIAALRQSGTMTEDELTGVKRVLTAAAMTYVAAMTVSLMSLLRLLLIANRKR